MSTISTETPTPTAFSTPNESPPPGLGIQDLQNLLIILDLACQRGAFRAAELTQIGQVFDRVNQFLQSTLPPQESSTAAMSGMPVPTPVTPSPMAPPFTPKIGA